MTHTNDSELFLQQDGSYGGPCNRLARALETADNVVPGPPIVQELLLGPFERSQLEITSNTND